MRTSTALQTGTGLPIANNSPIQKIVIIVAMQEEADPIIRELGMRQDLSVQFTPQLKLKAYSGTLKGRKIHLVINGPDPFHGVAGVGTTAATLTTLDTIRALKPDTIVSAGTAGGFATQGARIGDIYIGSEEIDYHDRRIPLGPFRGYGEGHYPCLEAPAIVARLGLKSGIISTGNSLNLSPTDEKCLASNRACAKEMEVAAIAETAQRFGVRVMAVKAITNLAGTKADASEQFQTNFELATSNLAKTLPKILAQMIRRTPEELRAKPTLPTDSRQPSGLFDTPPRQHQEAKNQPRISAKL